MTKKVGQLAADPTLTLEFSGWFRGSQFVDEDGRPRVAYHGTSSKEPFDTFDLARAGQTAGVGGGIFFTNRRDVAEDVYGWRSGRPAMAVYLKMERPLTLDAYLEAKGLDRDVELHGGFDSPTNYFDNTHPAMVDFARANGYDSIWLTDDSGDESACDLYLVFDPGQIKSAESNSGEFNPNNPSILRSAVTTPEDFAPPPDALPIDLDALAEKDRDDADFYPVAVASIGAHMKSRAAVLGVVMEFSPWKPHDFVTAIELTDFFADEPGQGAGTQLMNELNALAEQFGLGVYISPSSPRNREFYGRFGYENARYLPYTYMVRFPPAPEDQDELQSAVAPGMS